MRRIFGIGVLMTVVLFNARCAAEVDSDGDGVIDSEDPDPKNSVVVPWRSLAIWHFDEPTLAADKSQLPVLRTGVTAVPKGFAGGGVQFPAARSALRYRTVEASGRPNIAPIRGTVLLRLKPNWSSGSGPGEWVTLLQTTNFALRISPNGSQLAFVSRRAGSTVTNAQIGLTFRANIWSYILATYSPEESSLSVDAPSTRVNGTGVVPPANFNDANGVFTLGAAADGTGSINGTIDELVTFNAPGVLALTPSLISAVASDKPAGLNLIWSSPTNAITEVRRRVVGQERWEPGRVAFGTNYFDSSVLEGERYEYNLNSRIADLKTGLPEDTGEFIKACRQGTPLHRRGKLILLVDQTLIGALEPDLSGFISNLIGDGWEILRLDVPRHVDDYTASSRFLTNYSAMVNVIKPFIRSNYERFGSEIKYVLCLGHVPVPYTGTLADDGHNSTAFHGAHTGAWASDLFYGDVDGVWTDSLNSTNSSYSFNWNIPGDGRFDQNLIPENPAGVARLEIPVARIDLANLPAFPEGEVMLLKRYLRKDADFRAGLKAFSANAISAEYILPNSPLAGQLAREMLSKVKVLAQPLTGDVFADSRSFLFGIQSGPGAFDRINDALPNYEHTTAAIAHGITGGKCAFIYVRGSYFPDWNTQNNFLRSILGLPNGGLTSAAFLVLNKAWRADGLGVGLSIGDEMLEVVNTWSVPGNAQSVRTVELLGDPTLHYPILPPPGGPGWTVTRDAVTVYWSPAAGATGYYVYRSATGLTGPFQLLNSAPLAETSFTENAASGGQVYMVRAAALTVSGAGDFTNLSQGVFTGPIALPEVQK